ALQEQPSNARTALAGRSDGTEENRAYDHVEIRVVHNYDAVVSAEFEQRASEPLADGLCDDPADVARSGRAHERDPAIFEHPRADRVIGSDDERQDALPAVTREHAPADMLHGDRTQWCLERWLPNHGVAADHRDESVPAPDGDGKVEGRNDADHAER